MAIFNSAFQITMGNEGGYANNPADSGGETYKGIAKNYWPNWEGWPAVDQAISTHPQKINTTLAANNELQIQVQAFYKQNFWDTISLDHLNGQQLANQLFDTAVNMGVGIATRTLQQAVNNIIPGKLTVDGRIGPETLDAVNGLPQEEVYNQVIALRKQRYINILQQHPAMAQFRNSWLSRLTPFNPQLP